VLSAPIVASASVPATGIINPVPNATALGDHLALEVDWQGGTPPVVEGSLVHLEFRLHGARLYSWWFDGASVNCSKTPAPSLTASANMTALATASLKTDDMPASSLLLLTAAQRQLPPPPWAGSNSPWSGSNCSCTAFCAGTCAINASSPVNMTLYRMTMQGVTTLADKDSGDAAGDTSFLLKTRAYALKCRRDPTAMECRQAQFAGDQQSSTDLVVAFEVEVDGAWGPYLQVLLLTNFGALLSFGRILFVRIRLREFIIRGSYLRR
jgi:hypothetical protein